jgi:hypothetical protein
LACGQRADRIFCPWRLPCLAGQAGFASLPVLPVFGSSGRRDFLSVKKMKAKMIMALTLFINKYTYNVDYL